MQRQGCTRAHAISPRRHCHATARSVGGAFNLRAINDDKHTKLSQVRRSVCCTIVRLTARSLPRSYKDAEYKDRLAATVVAVHEDYVPRATSRGKKNVQVLYCGQLTDGRTEIRR